MDIFLSLFFFILFSLPFLSYQIGVQILLPQPLQCCTLPYPALLWVFCFFVSYLLYICYIYVCCLLYIFELYIFFACFGFLCSTFCVINMNHVFHLAHYKMHVRRSLLGIGQCRELECIGALKRRRGS